jgi:hypothetical protein
VGVTVGGQRQVVALSPAPCPAPAGGFAPACNDVAVATFAPVVASHLTVDAATVEEVTTAQGPKPLAILEVAFAPGGNQPFAADARAGSGCRPGLVWIDGTVTPVRIDASRGDLLSGAAAPFTSCADTVMAAGTHSLDAEVGVDTLLLEAGPAPQLPGASAPPTPVRVRRLDPTHVRVRVTTAGPAVLTSGESFDAGWQATVNGHRLQLASLDTQSGWRLPSAGAYTVDLRFAPQRTYNAALLVTLAGVSLCLALVLLGRRRG